MIRPGVLVASDPTGLVLVDWNVCNHARLDLIFRLEALDIDRIFFKRSNRAVVT